MVNTTRPKLNRCSCTLAAALLCLFALTFTQAGGAQQCNGEESRCFHGDRLNKRSAAVSIDPTNCLVQGSGVGPNIIVSNKNLITDSGGANIYVSITNKCLRGSNIYCIEATGTTNVVGSQIIGKMTDNSDGTYSYSYSIGSPGFITVAIILVTHVDVAAVFYNSINLSGLPYNSKSFCNLSNNWGDGFITDRADDVSARFTGTFVPFTTEIYTLTLGCKMIISNYCFFKISTYDDGSDWYIDENKILSNLSLNAAGAYSTTMSLQAFSIYTLRVEWHEISGGAYIILKWSSSTISDQVVSADNFGTSSDVSLSPYQIKVVCPVGYTPGGPNLLKCVVLCGDGLRYENEVCDDGNTANGDGCRNDCMQIDDGWICVGGNKTYIKFF